jgi:hypothetical protein
MLVALTPPPTPFLSLSLIFADSFSPIERADPTDVDPSLLLLRKTPEIVQLPVLATVARLGLRVQVPFVQVPHVVTHVLIFKIFNII